MSKSTIKFDLNSLSNVLRMTKIDPCLPARHLRSLLENCLPNNYLIDAQFLDNFRKRCQLYHATHSVVTHLQQTDAANLMSQNKISNKELTILDSDDNITNIHQV